MTLQEKIDEMYRQLHTATNSRKRKELRKAIARAEQKRRELKKGETWCC